MPNILLTPPPGAKCRATNCGLNLDDDEKAPKYNCEFEWCWKNGWPIVFHRAIKTISDG